MSSSAGYNVWGVITGALGTLGLLPIAFAVIGSQLPSTRLRILDRTLQETESLLRSISEEGLFLGSSFIPATEHRLSNIHTRAEPYRMATYCAMTLSKQIKEMMKGLSQKISVLCDEVKEVRANISTTTAEERRRMQIEGLQSAGQQGLLADRPGPSADYSSQQHLYLYLHGARQPSTSMSDILVDSQSLVEQGSSSTTTDVSDATKMPSFVSSLSADKLPAGLGSSNSTAVVGCPSTRANIPRALHRALRRIDHDLAVQGRRHPLLARIVRSNPIALKTSRLPKSGRRQSTILSECSVTILVNDNSKKRDEDDGWEDDV